MKYLLSILFFFIFFSSEAPKVITVAQEGKADCRTIQSALDAVPSNCKKKTIIKIKEGIYKEFITVDATKNNVTLIGDNKATTIITYDNHAGTRLENGDTLNTWTCASVFVYGNDFHAEGITFQNNAGFTEGQAVALRVEGTRASFKKCSMVGFQDVLFLSGSGSKQYFNNCYIEGTTDFIFGASTALFDSCHLHSKKNTHVTAASTNSIIPYGFVFRNCKLTADTNINKVSLGRPWSPTASVTYLNCWMGSHIISEGWSNWKNPNNESTARYAEYNSSGPGANRDLRVKWSKQLTEEEASKYTLKNILGNWNPEQQ